MDTGTSQLHALVSGKGEPTIILEAGMGGISVDWTFVQPELSKFSTVLSYDRAGYGWSKTNEERVTSEEYVEDLRIAIGEIKAKTTLYSCWTFFWWIKYAIIRSYFS